jgi:hypothetical protein
MGAPQGSQGFPFENKHEKEPFEISAAKLHDVTSKEGGWQRKPFSRSNNYARDLTTPAKPLSTVVSDRLNVVKGLKQTNLIVSFVRS